MVKHRLPEGAREDEWLLACACADFHLLAQIYRQYGHSNATVCDDFHRLLRDCISDEDTYDLALAAVRTTFDAHGVHQRCKRHLRRVNQELRWATLRKSRLPASHSRAWKRSEVGRAISHHRYQLPVGQGGFHIGTLKDLGPEEASWRGALTGDAVEDADFVYAYDCGSDPIAGVVNAASTIAKRRPSRLLDMLFVSHFDRDHICGIPHLLHPRKGMQVDTIVMPYLDDVDRIIAFGRCADRAETGASARFHEDMVVDPVDTMGRFDPRQIILIMPSDEDSEAGFFDLPPADPPSSPARGAPWKAADANGGRAAPPQARTTSDGATVLRRAEFDIAGRDSGGWRLKPHVKRAELHDREAFAAAIEVLLRWPRGSFRDRVQDKRLRRAMVTEHRTMVSRAYAWTFGDKNETSLSLYSGPLNPEDAGAVFRNMPETPVARVGWLGTGDAGLRDHHAVRLFRDFYRDELDWVSTFVLPHHGSIHNYDPDFPVTDADVWVAAAQPTHRSWKHPAPEIVAAIKSSGAKFRKVGSNPRSLLEERMVVFWTR